ncbi:MAG: ROK family transcriptional regulator [Actinocatenispora sp.]
MRSGTNLPRVGGYNQAVILDAIRQQDGVSRVELAHLTGLTNQTVSNIVRRLLDAGLVAEAGRAPSRGGKRRTLLTVCPDACFSVGVHLDPDVAVTVLVDLSGRILTRHRRRLPTHSDPARLVPTLARAVDRVITDARVEPTRVLGLGVAVPGPLDTRHGIVVEPPNLAGWHQVALRDALREATGLPVVVDNDATAAAVGERWAGGSERTGSFLFVYLGTGIGAGIVYWDRVLRGDSGNAGEFGHTIVVPDGRSCRCGARGCLEAHCSPAAMLADLLDRHGRLAAKRLQLELTEDSTRTDYAKLCRAARDGDDAALDTVQLAAHRIGQASLTAVNLLDVSRVVLGGDASRGIGALIRAEIDRQVNGHAIARRVRTVSIEHSIMGADAGAVGAASLVLHGAYAPGWRMLLADNSPA